MLPQARDPLGNSATSWLAGSGFNFVEISGQPNRNPRRNQGTGMTSNNEWHAGIGQRGSGRYIGNVRPPSNTNQSRARESLMRNTGEWATRDMNPHNNIDSGPNRPESRSNIYSQEVSYSYSRLSAQSAQQW